MMNKEELLKVLSECVVEMEDEKVIGMAEEYIQSGYPAIDGIMQGLVDGMNKVADLYENEEYFIPELLICSDAMYNGLDVLRPYLEKSDSQQQCKVVIGVVEGDTHDLGKNLVKIMLESAGYELIDLGRDVPPVDFINVVKEKDASVVALSTLMSTATSNMKRVVELLVKEGMRDSVKVIIGGGPTSPEFAKKIGADGYSKNAVEAVKLVNRLMGT
ncbi:methylmalonyl-CoA mutase C-terminal domain-containing protein/methyltransferase cognate corrinoid proteins [Anaerovirgula multivorans]|uniref:Methylmalonyl-CoA mutase C-terminal domain-containing protein/methyltransferase cognate corrinoid proteins n=1 Tax=Anaerovirgula multivorans TaxID=312168 RepID=A0A239D128_9FIRM|nr:corrinoid protein [Anaerovirgula multivorans]SNS25728.1 methylmalonyl-CoA mutase C-terminal domain-containing protein/methyltransferase cognate corrinoid proteins [Anaerovirgula multivorans]